MGGLHGEPPFIVVRICQLITGKQSDPQKRMCPADVHICRLVQIPGFHYLEMASNIFPAGPGYALPCHNFLINIIRSAEDADLVGKRGKLL